MLDHSTELGIEFARQALVLSLFVAAPVLVVGLLVSFVVSLLQAVTQVQEQTLSLIPRIVAMVVVAIMLAPWMSQHLVEFARAAFGNGMLR